MRVQNGEVPLSSASKLMTMKTSMLGTTLRNQEEPVLTVITGRSDSKNCLMTIS